MKKNLFIPMGLALLIAITLTFCAKNVRQQEEPVPLQQPISVTHSLDPQAEYATGDIQIQTNHDGDIVVLVNGKDTAHSRMFLLEGGKFSLNETMEKGEVVYLLHGILINSLDKKERYYFYISKPDEKLMFSKLPDSYKSFFTNKATGYGVVRMYGTLPTNISSFQYNSETYSDLTSYRLAVYRVRTGNKIITDDPVGGLGGSSCSSGGEGATSCSINGQGGCSVSCLLGYYACCNSGQSGSTCKCIKNRQL